MQPASAAGECKRPRTGRDAQESTPALVLRCTAPTHAVASRHGRARCPRSCWRTCAGATPAPSSARVWALLGPAAGGRRPTRVVFGWVLGVRARAGDALRGPDRLGSLPLDVVPRSDRGLLDRAVGQSLDPPLASPRRAARGSPRPDLRGAGARSASWSCFGYVVVSGRRPGLLDRGWLPLVALVAPGGRARSASGSSRRAPRDARSRPRGRRSSRC